MVAEKTDGVRYLLAIDGGESALIGRNLSQLPVTLKGVDDSKCDSPWRALLDGELVCAKGDPTTKFFVVYDALLTSRGCVATLGLDARLSALREDFFSRASEAPALSLSLTRARVQVHARVLMKAFVPLDKGLEHYRRVVPTLPYRSDGLILTPVNEPIKFGTSPSLFKWKVLEANTVDFWLTPSSAEGSFSLSVVDRGNEVEIGRTCVDRGSMAFMLLAMDIQRGRRPIYECAWDRKTGTWQPVKERKDKERPNSVMTYKATLRNLQEDIRVEELFNAP